MLVDGVAVSGSLFDFALYFYHNAHELVKRGFGPYFYLPKMEHYLEARFVAGADFVVPLARNWMGTR